MSKTNAADSNFSYLSLTPELQLDALASIGIYPETGLMALNSYENRVLVFSDENKIRYVVKFYRPHRWSEAQLQEDHDFSIELNDQGCAVSAPVCINQQTLFKFQDYYFALFKSLSARSLELDNADQLYEVGIALGKLHRIGAQGRFSVRETLDVKTLLSGPIAQLKESTLPPAFVRDELFQVMDKIEKIATQRIEKQPVANIRLQGDCHASNILMDGKTPYFVDFDDCKMGPAVQDIWMLLSGDTQEKQMQLSNLLEGYEQEFEFDNSELRLIEVLRSMRMIHYVSWINKRWADPTFPLNFPWFTTDEYWKELLQSLQQQIVNMDNAPLSVQPNY